MKITGARVFKYWVHWRNWVFVRLDTDEGLHGLQVDTLQCACPAGGTSVVLSRAWPR